jgi:phospholipid-transporting ATPase
MPNSHKYNMREIQIQGRKDPEKYSLPEKTSMTHQESGSTPMSLTYDENLQVKIAFGDEQLRERHNNLFRNNKISTTKYNIVTWVPKSLLLQFRRIANVYFLFISILTCFSFSPKNPVTMIGTFAMVLVFTMCKEAYEDIKRFRQDKEVNMKTVTYYNQAGKKYEQKLWQNIQVGDIIKVNNEEDVPADMLLLKSSLDSGLCFVDSMNLDGETNLKEKMIPPGLKNLSYDNILRSSGFIICEKPHENLESWESCLVFLNEKEQIICNLKQLILKGCKLKNTQTAIGIVVYTGHTTKIMKNAKTPPIKISNLMKTMNRLLYSVFVFQVLLCILFSLGSIIWKNNLKINNYNNVDNIYTPWYLPVSDDDFFTKFLTFIVAFSHLIPISLYVALEIVKLMQSLLIYYDRHIFDKVLNKPATARTSDLIEELGQVEFIFSDKTGTLTKNEMEFRKCCVNFNIYGDMSNSTDSITLESKAQNTINGDPKAYKILISPTGENMTDKQKLNEFFTVCSVCHSAYVADKEDGAVFQSSSPDEVALLQGAAQMGFAFHKRTSETIETITPTGEYQIWNLLLELPFDSTRKRMSVIVSLANSGSSANKNNQNGINGFYSSSDKDKVYYLFTKGADSSMLSKMNLTDDILTQIKSNYYN